MSVGIESSGAGVFEPVGAGGHYLQLGSPHRNVGTKQPAFDYLEGRVRFEVDAVGDSVLQWQAGGQPPNRGVRSGNAYTNELRGMGLGSTG